MQILGCLGGGPQHRAMWNSRRVEEVHQAGEPHRRSWQWPRDGNSAKAWVWVVQAWEVTVCLETSKIAKATPLGESVLTENLGRDNTFM